MKGPWIVALAGSMSVLWSCSSTSPSAVDPHSSESRRIAGLWWMMFWVGLVVYAVVLAFVGASFSNRRRHPNDKNSAEDDVPVEASVTDHRRSNRFIVGGGLGLPLLVLTLVGVATIRTTNAAQPAPAVISIRVEAKRWWWRLTYTNEGVVTANEIHVPVGQPVELTLTSDNVLHSLWVPQLNGKTDVVPGQTNHMTFTADSVGTYRGQCAEFCGIGHAKMAFVVIVDSSTDYATWLQSNQRPALVPQSAAAQRGADVFTNGSCAGCHTVTGTAAAGTSGPDLTHFGSRTSIAALTLPNTPAELTRWLTHTQDVKRGALMPQIDLTDAQVAALVAFLEGLQ